MNDDVRAELELTRAYARSVERAITRDAGRTDLAPLAKAYIGGVLTTLRNLKLITTEEHAEWSRLLGTDLPR
jgi:hypothetical protein